jgi:hypothetical protein
MVRIGGWMLMATAVTQALATVFDPDLTVGVNAIVQPWWIPSHLAFCIAYTLALPGLMALYLRHSGRFGLLGEAGVVLAMFGSAMTVMVSMLVGAGLPLIAAEAPDLTRSLMFFEPGKPLHFMRPMVAITAVTYFPGFILTGVAVARANVLSRWAAWCLVAGALGTLGALAGPGQPGQSITLAGSLLLGVAFGRLGWQLFKLVQPGNHLAL